MVCWFRTIEQDQGAMITTFQYFVSYLIVDVLCLALTVIIASNVSRDSGSETQVRFFFLALTAFTVFEVFDAVWALIAYSGLVSASAELMSLVNGINLTAIAFAAYFWLGFILARFESQVTNSKPLRLLAMIPALLVPVIHIIGFFTGQNVTFLPGGGMSYGICHLLITCIQLLYVLAATLFALHRYRHATTRQERRLSLVFMSFMVPFVLAGTIDALIAGTPVAAAGISVSMVFVMMSMQDLRISSDVLTGLNNRRRADEFLEENMARVSPERPLYLFIIDLNDFKRINDTYGHLEGDHALKLAADVLRRVAAETNGFAARWGGDEFLIVCAEPVGDELVRVPVLVKDTLANAVSDAHLEYPLTCSIGCAACESHHEDYAQLLARADVELYEAKRARL